MSILALDKFWVPHRWMSIEAAITLEAKELVLDHLGEAIYVYRGGINHDGVQSRIETNSIIVVDGAPSHRKYRIPALTNSSLFQRDRCMCAYCGNVFKPADLTRDHIIPQSKGGPDVWTNVVASCKGCNSLKNDLMPGQKLPKDSNGRQILGPQGTSFMSPLMVPYTPDRAEAMLLKNRNIRCDQMAFLLTQVSNKNSRMFDHAMSMFGKDELEKFSFKFQ